MGSIFSTEAEKRAKARQSQGWPTLKLRVSEYGYQGLRPSMQDDHFVDKSLAIGDDDCTRMFFAGVYDGHGGDECAKYCASKFHKTLTKCIRDALDGKSTAAQSIDPDAATNDATPSPFYPAIIEAFQTFDDKILEKLSNQKSLAGSTAAVLMIDEEARTICSSNVGDAKVVLGLNNRYAESMSVEHKPFDPKEGKRIINAGHYVQSGRIDGCLAVSRAFGDLPYKIGGRAVDGKLPEGVQFPQRTLTKGALDSIPAAQRPCSSLPYVKQLKLEKSPWFNVTFAVIACDGLFDVFSEQDVVDFIRIRFSGSKILEGVPKDALEIVSAAASNQLSSNSPSYRPAFLARSGDHTDDNNDNNNNNNNNNNNHQNKTTEMKTKPGFDRVPTLTIPPTNPPVNGPSSPNLALPPSLNVWSPQTPEQKKHFADNFDQYADTVDDMGLIDYVDRKPLDSFASKNKGTSKTNTGKKKNSKKNKNKVVPSPITTPTSRSFHDSPRGVSFDFDDDDDNNNNNNHDDEGNNGNTDKNQNQNDINVAEATDSLKHDVGEFKAISVSVSRYQRYTSPPSSFANVTQNASNPELLDITVADFESYNPARSRHDYIGNRAKSAEDKFDHLAHDLCKEAVRRGSKDNVSVVVVFFDWSN